MKENCYETSNESLAQFFVFSGIKVCAEIRRKTITDSEGNENNSHVLYFLCEIGFDKKKELLDFFFSSEGNLKAKNEGSSWGKEYHEAYKKIKDLRIESWKAFNRNNKGVNSNGQ